MRPSTLIAAIFAGGALAAPLQANRIQERALVYHTEVEVVTITVTAGYGAPTTARKHKHKPGKPKQPKPTPPPPPPAPAPVPEPAPAPPAPAPAPPAPAPAPPAPAPAPPAPAPVYAPAPAPKPAPAPAPVANSGNSMLDVANKYRSQMGLNKFEWSENCAKNAQTTGQMNGGSLLEHTGRPINSGQVISPGAADNFEMVYAGGWLCEVPTGPLASVCGAFTADLHIDHQGKTGHYEILTNPSYKTIGCAFTPDASGKKPFYDVWGGQWVCNLDF